MQRDAVRKTVIRIYRPAHVFVLAEVRRVRAEGDPAGVAANSETAGRSSRAGSGGEAS
jgi:hypothetical protein